MTLIEVLVVMVVLVVGIFAAVRLFPPGLLTIKQTQEQTMAQRLATEELDRWEAHTANLPSGVIGIAPVQVGSGYAYSYVSNIPPWDLTDFTSAPYGVDPYFISDINRIRRIIGETIKIPVPTPTVAGSGSIYTVMEGPIFYNPNDPNSDQELSITGSPLARSVQSSANLPVVGRPGAYAIDYAGNAIAFYPLPYSRNYTLTISYYDNNGQVLTLPPQTIFVPPGNTVIGPVWQPLPNLPTGAIGWAPESDVVARKFDYLGDIQDGTALPFSPLDPYQYKLLQSNDGPYANIGILVFNPIGYNRNEPSATGPVPLVAHIDYTVWDWHIIRDDRTMPADPPYTVDLTLNHLKKIGEIQGDNTPYEGLFRDTQVPVDMMIYNLNTGERIPPTDYTVDYRNGVVQFNNSFGNSHAGATFRFFYEAHGAWGVQIQKAYGVYTRAFNPNAPNQLPATGLVYDQYFVGNGTVGSPTRLYFPICDAGKTIVLNNFYYKVSGQTTPVHGQNQAFQINSNPALFESIGPNGSPLTWIDLTSQYPNATGWDFSSVGAAAIGVQGVSFEVRVIWSDGADIDQSSNPPTINWHWHHYELNTFLTRTTN